MRRSTPTWLIPTLLGLAVGALAILVALVGGAGLLRIQVSASDLLFLRAGGPRWGVRPAPANIVLVQYDRRSASAMQSVPTYEQDAQLYRALLDAGAAQVADTRMVADAGPFEASPVRPLLDAMHAIDAQGKLLRDVWLANHWPADTLDRYRPLVAHNLLNMHPNSDSFFDTRLYPLVVLSADGLQESMPLVLARRALSIPADEASSVLDELKRSGVIALWQSTLPEHKSLPALLRADAVAAVSDYRFGALRIPWYPLRSNSPLVPPAGYWISYAATLDGIERVSYIDATTPEAAAKFKGKIVLIGYKTSTDPTSDTYNAPTSSDRAPAVEVVAAALQTLLGPDLLRPMPRAYFLASIMLLAWLAALAGGLLRPERATAALALILGAFLVAAVMAFRAGCLVDVVVAPAACLSAGALGTGYRYWREVKAKSRIVDLFGRYVPKAVVTQLIQQREADALALGGVNRNVTVLFADIRGFTTYAERVPPEEVLRQLNSLLKILVDCTFANEGTVDKFIGDAILVLFNAPLDQPDHVLRAARTALAMKQGLLNHASGLAVGIGIHRGEAVVGRVGTPERMEYTAIGSTVNIASRLCSAAQSGQIVVSQEVARLLTEEFTMEAQPPLHVKGVAEPLSTSLLLSQKKLPSSR